MDALCGVKTTKMLRKSRRTRHVQVCYTGGGGEYTTTGSPSKVGAGEDLGALADEVLDGGHGGTDAGVVGDGLAVEGDVEVATDEDLLALEVALGEVSNVHLGLELGGEPGGGAGGEG